MTIKGANTLSGWGIAPHILVSNVEAATQFYQRAFGAEVVFRDTELQRSTTNVRLRIGESSMSLSQVSELGSEGQNATPLSLATVQISLELFVDDFDVSVERALLSGATISATFDVDGCFGERVCALIDPFGLIWVLSTFLDDGGALCV